MQPTNPLAWQTALIDSEVDCILRCGSGSDKEGGWGSGGANAPGRRGRAGGGGLPPERWEFLRRGAGRTSSGGSVVGGAKDAEGGCAGVGDGAASAGGDTRRQEIVPGEVCPVCQEEMEGGGGDEERSEGAAAVARAGLTYCVNGCGNNMHARCVCAACAVVRCLLS